MADTKLKFKLEDSQEFYISGIINVIEGYAV